MYIHETQNHQEMVDKRKSNRQVSRQIWPKLKVAMQCTYMKFTFTDFNTIPAKW